MSYFRIIKIRIAKVIVFTTIFIILSLKFNYKDLFVGSGGFEPPKSETTDLQSVPFGRSGNCPIEPKKGVEPATC